MYIHRKKGFPRLFGLEMSHVAATDRKWMMQKKAKQTQRTHTKSTPEESRRRCCDVDKCLIAPGLGTQESTAQKKGSVYQLPPAFCIFIYFFEKGVGVFFFFWGGRESDDNQCTCVWARDFIHFFLLYFRKKKGSVSQPTGKCRTPAIRFGIMQPGYQLPATRQTLSVTAL